MMQLNRLKLGFFLTSVTLLSLTTSKVMAQELGFWGEQAKPHCIQDALLKPDVSQEENPPIILFHCGREEYTTQPPFR
ncbi:hypothetical protein [Lyngbya sp. PCC 8106]|uniref:hypothetical protein n=1 Tax=Lyngbya sp. (strain PCC 8106) TaxID=313612 RepID=UPI0012EA6E87|nr:hypothetical protein [Lyngbya sp. PCC 8106]